MTLTTSTRGWTGLRAGKMLVGKSAEGTYQTPSLWCCTGRQLHSLQVLPHSSLLSSLGWPCVHPQPTQLEKTEWDVDDLVTDSRVTWCAEVLMGDSSWSAVQLRTAVRQLSWRALCWCCPSVPSPMLGSTSRHPSNSDFGWDLPLGLYGLWKYGLSLGRGFELFL